MQARELKDKLKIQIYSGCTVFGDGVGGVDCVMGLNGVVLE